MGVLIEVNARSDGYTLGQIIAGAGHAHADERFGIGAHPPAQLVADRRQRTLFFELKEQFHGAQRRRRENHAPTGKAPTMPVESGRGLHRENFIPSAAVGHSIERLNIYHSSLGENFGAVLLCEVQIVLVERVLGAVTTTHHAAAARRAGRSLRPFPPEEYGSGKVCPPGCPSGDWKDGNMRPVEGVPRPPAASATFFSRRSAGPRILFSVTPSIREAVA